MPGAFERLTPPWEEVGLLRHPEGLAEGDEVELRVGSWPVRMRWLARIEEVRANRGFRDVQVRGPFAAWAHEHRFEPSGTEQAILRDEVKYALPLDPLARPIAGPFVKQKLKRMFAYRHCITERDLKRNRESKMKTMRIAITGASGLVGSALVPLLRSAGHEVLRLVRRPAKSDDEVQWHPGAGFPAGTEKLEGCDAVIHLAGENIAGGRWSDERRRRIRSSRVEGTRTLCEALAQLKEKPEVLISSSAIGYYGETGDAWADETSPRGSGFLPEVSQEWEEATFSASDAGIRVVLARTGIVLSPRGGALEKMLPLFRLGVGGALGNGRQYMSWISIEDEIGAFLHCLSEKSIEGPVNFTAPNPVTNRDFTKTLARVIHRPVAPPVPGFALRLLYGKMADEALLRSTRVRPGKLEETGYTFLHHHLKEALHEVLGRPKEE
ncbi:MAG: uncharacterized protein PWP23_577 [Candidatus Sumerlaeota bacterium]|nr:uncharacterized protein [Candidatus Sumerlaeota bacterium]